MRQVSRWPQLLQMAFSCGKIPLYSTNVQGVHMIRTHILPCALPRQEADALNRESGRIYTDVLVWHYRIYRRTGHWLSPGADERLNDSFGPSTLHAHSRDAAQQGFHKACKTARTNRAQGRLDSFSFAEAKRHCGCGPARWPQHTGRRAARGLWGCAPTSSWN